MDGWNRQRAGWKSALVHLVTSTALLLGSLTACGLPADTQTSAYIVQAESAQAAATAVAAAGGTVTRPLAIIDGVGATLSDRAARQLRLRPGFRVVHDPGVRTTTDLRLEDDAPLKRPTPTVRPTPRPVPPPNGPQNHEVAHTRGYQLYPASATGAYQLRTPPHDIQGRGTTIAVIDSGLLPLQNPNAWTEATPAEQTLLVRDTQSQRFLVYRDFLPLLPANGNLDAQGRWLRNSVDQHGHGTHVVSTILDNRSAALTRNPASAASPVGVAPQANMVVARALNKDGEGSYADIIAAIEWIVATRDVYQIRVLNLSLYSPVSSPYWADPLNQAVMRAWQAGITVVVAAGNAGPEAASITAPGNVPYVVTVGAVKSGRYTPSGYDELASYSARGPTESAFVKPDLVVLASRTIAPLPEPSTLAAQVPAGYFFDAKKVSYGFTDLANQKTYYQLSGTSMAAAEVSGVVALVLERSPGLSNDQVKFRLLTTADTAIDEASGAPFYSIWEQGAGLVDTLEAVLGSTVEAANGGMDIEQDLTSDTHYWGYTSWDEASGEFQLLDPSSGQPWSVWSGGSKSWSGGSKSWSGGSKSWSGGSKSWSGGSKSWSGGLSSWAGSESLWAGAGRIWAGSSGVGSAAAANDDLLLDDGQQPSGMQLYLPLVHKAER